MLKDEISKLCPRPSSPAKSAIWDQYVDGICDNPDLFVEASIDTQLEWCHLIAQWAHETGGFTILWESGSYSAEGLMRVFGVGVHSAKVTRDEAVELCSKTGTIELYGKKVPAKDYAIFERVYGLGNPKKAAELGNTEPGDGYRYRGYFIVQLTGKRDHERLLEGDYSVRKGLQACLAEWTEKNCGKYACADDCKRVTKLINGGYNGLAERQALLSKAKRIWKECPDFEGLGGTEPPNDEDDEALAPMATPTKTMAESKTGNASIAVGGLTGLQSYSTMVKAGTAAVKTAPTAGAAILALMADQEFMLAAATLVVGVAGTMFIWWDRREKMRKHGI